MNLIERLNKNIASHKYRQRWGMSMRRISLDIALGEAELLKKLLTNKDTTKR